MYAGPLVTESIDIQLDELRRTISGTLIPERWRKPTAHLPHKSGKCRPEM